METFRINVPFEVIREVQTFLLELAYAVDSIPKITIDGIYNTETRDAVSAYQRYAGLPETGTVNFETWQRMAGDYATLRLLAEPAVFLEDEVFDLQLGDTGHHITTLQSQLGEFSYIYPNVIRPAITGQFGLTTAQAVRALQRNYGEYESGAVTKTLWNKMQEDYRAKREHARQTALNRI